MNIRVKDYTLLRLTFEFQKQKTHPLALMNGPSFFNTSDSSMMLDQTQNMLMVDDSNDLNLQVTQLNQVPHFITEV